MKRKSRSKLTCRKRLRKQLQTRRKKKGTGKRLATSWKLSSKRKEEDEAMCLMEEMRKNVEAATTQKRGWSKVCAALFENTSIVTTKIRSCEDTDDEMLAIDAKPGY